MAGDWIPVRARLRDEPEVQNLVEITGRSLHEVMGLLVDLWGWAQEISEDGKICAHSVRMLCAVVGGDEIFWNAVVAQHWLDLSEGVRIPNWNRWLDRGAKRRLKNRQRMKISRRNKCGKEHAKKRAHSVHMKAHYRTGQDSTSSHTPTPRKRGGVCVQASPDRNGPEDGSLRRNGADGQALDEAWQFVVAHVQTHKKWVKDPVPWAAKIRRENPGKFPQEVPGFEWLAEAQAQEAKPTEDQLRREYMEELNGKPRSDDPASS